MSDSNQREISRLFEGLSHRYRRVVCYYLRDHGTASLDTLADAVTGWAESGPGPGESVDREDVRVQLYHVHLSTLDAAGLVEFDRDAETVAFDDPSETATGLLDAALAADTTDTDLDLEAALAGGASGAQDGSRADETGVDDGG